MILRCSCQLECIKVTVNRLEAPSGGPFGGDNNMNSENLQGRSGLGKKEWRKRYISKRPELHTFRNPEFRQSLND